VDAARLAYGAVMGTRERRTRARIATALGVVVAALGLAQSPATAGTILYGNSPLPQLNGFDVLPGGRLQAFGLVAGPLGDAPQDEVVSPDQRSMYVATANEVLQYSIGLDGSLTPKTPAGVPAGDFSNDGITMSPDGRNVYMGRGHIWQFSVNPLDGTLMPKSPASVGAPGGAFRLRVTPDSRSLYTVGLNSTVSQFDINPITGALTPKTPATLTAPCCTSDLAILPNGTAAYVVTVDFADGVPQLLQFRVGTGGRLAPMTPAALGLGGLFAFGVQVSPDGHNVYATSLGDSVGDGVISQFAVGAGGALAPLSPGVVGVATGARPRAIAVTPNGQNVYITLEGANAIAQFARASTGARTPLTPATVPSGDASALAIAALPNTYPHARLTAKPLLATAGQPVTFDGSASSDANGIRDLARWRLSPGDATTPVSGSGVPPAAILHTYAQAGAYVAQLRVTDRENASTTTSLLVTVLPATGGSGAGS
jgi:6-phosphogluconolactonase (cycloisomerase 2 family)